MPIRLAAVFVGTTLIAAFVVGLPEQTRPPGETAPPPPSRPQLPPGYEKWAVVTGFDAPVFDQFEPGRRVIGRIRRGGRVAVRPARTERTCYAHETRGVWFATPGGYICTSYGMLLGSAEDVVDGPKRRITGEIALPFDYVKVTQVGADRYDRPAVDLDHRVQSQTKAFFLAVGEVLEVDGRTWIRTVYDEYTLKELTRPVQPPSLQGLRLSARDDLPIAFVVGDGPALGVKCDGNGDEFDPCGEVDKYTTFTPTRRVVVGETEYVVDETDRFYPAENVRVANWRRRPVGVPPGARWVHIDLDEQVFVAYADNSPRYVSLISTGVEGHDTPTGLFRTQRKYITKTMRGPDDTHGRYRVEEIPWVMYYDGNYAVHGAYWHHKFGNVRSHGCTNVAPVDAQWLFNWDTTPMPDGWHSNLDASGGLYFYFSQDREETES